MRPKGADVEGLKQKRGTQRTQISRLLSEIDSTLVREELVKEELRILLARLDYIHS